MITFYNFSQNGAISMKPSGMFNLKSWNKTKGEWEKKEKIDKFKGRKKAKGK